MRKSEAQVAGLDLNQVVLVTSQSKSGPFVITAPGEPFALKIGTKSKSREMAHFLSKKHDVPVVTEW